MGETGFWRKSAVFSAVSCENLRFPAVFCANLRLPNPLIYRASRKSAKICKNLRKCAFRVRFLPFAVSLLARPEFRSGKTDPVQFKKAFQVSFSTSEQYSFMNLALHPGMTRALVLDRPDCRSLPASVHQSQWTIAASFAVTLGRNAERTLANGVQCESQCNECRITPMFSHL